MDRGTLSLILSGVVCGCCVLLCIVVSYLCVVVRRIRRDFSNLSKDGNIDLENALNKYKDEVQRKRVSSGPRYTGEPRDRPRQQSAVYSDPEETVTYLERGERQKIPDFGNAQALEPTNSTRDISEKAQAPETILLQFVNAGFSPDTTRDSTGDSSSETGDSQPIYSNEEAFPDQPIYENNNNEEDDDEPVYQNRGELAVTNNPEWNRCNTLDISQIS